MGDDLLDYDDDGYAYRMRPDGAGVYSYTLAQSILPCGRVPLIVAPRTSCISGLGRVKPT